MSSIPVFRPGLAVALALPWLAGCAGRVALSDHDCMTRVMYFESNRSSAEGMLAVGTTVMNRLDSPKYPKDICSVVAQPHQFAPGVLDKSMNPREAALPARVADQVLAGQRHPGVGDAMFFHTAGLTFPYKNMHYVLVAGGNAFYEKRSGTDRGTSDVVVASFAPTEPRIASGRPTEDPALQADPPEALTEDASEPAGAIARSGDEEIPNPD